MLLTSSSIASLPLTALLGVLCLSVANSNKSENPGCSNGAGPKFSESPPSENWENPLKFFEPAEPDPRNDFRVGAGASVLGSGDACCSWAANDCVRLDDSCVADGLLSESKS